jgi:hypothetical protein
MTVLHHKDNKKALNVAIQNKTKVNRYKHKEIPSFSKMERLLKKDIKNEQ